MSENKAYVGNLSYQTEESGLESFFAECGEVSEVKLIKDYEKGRSKGFAFVSFGSDEAFEAAIEKNGGELDGRSLRINKAEDRKKSGSGQGGPRRF